MLTSPFPERHVVTSCSSTNWKADGTVNDMIQGGHFGKGTFSHPPGLTVPDTPTADSTSDTARVSQVKEAICNLFNRQTASWKDVE
jgi:hypothetical protein